MQRNSGPRLHRYLLPLIVICLSLNPWAASFAQQARPGVIRVTASDESDKPVVGVLVEVKFKGTVSATLVTNDKGEAEFANLVPGSYEVVVSKESFEPLTQSDVSVTAGAPIEIRFTMIPKVHLNDAVTVHAGSQ